MSKPLGYWGCNHDFQLIADVSETFGDNLQNLNEFDQAWLIGKLGHYYWDTYCEDAPSDAAEKLVARLYELPRNQLGSLVQAIPNKSLTKPLGYWGCNYDIPLIQDIGETFGDNLQDLSEIDQVWLVARLGSHYWLRYCDDAPSMAAEELVNRLDELPKNQIGCLIRALANK
jgi:hypothetical protein